MTPIDGTRKTHTPDSTFDGMELRIWGARGSIPTPVPENLEHGGNTACLEVRLPTGESYIFDGGTGIRELGIHLGETRTGPQNLHVFMTHFHWDHVQGLPFFGPLYSPENHVTFHSSHSNRHLRDVLGGQMSAPYFPVNFELLQADMHFGEVGRDPVAFGELTVQSFPLHHPQGASGYRICYRDAVLVYASDLEHGNQELDAVLRENAKEADVLVYDAQFTPQEYDERRGWGHSTWLEATRVARDCGVRELVLFHHDPGHNDTTMHRIVEDARREFKATSAAWQGRVIAV
jgi:phosphoribosyl 1,2-cyclic phosphodiesterase